MLHLKASQAHYEHIVGIVLYDAAAHNMQDLWGVDTF